MTELEEIRQAFADYYVSEGCGCCEDRKKHKKANRRLGKLLKAEKFPNEKNYNWWKYATGKDS